MTRTKVQQSQLTEENVMSTSNKRERLKQLREASGMSQHRVAQKSGVRRNRVSLFECGYIDLADEEYGLIEHVLRDALIEKRGQLSAALFPNGGSK